MDMYKLLNVVVAASLAVAIGTVMAKVVTMIGGIVCRSVYQSFQNPAGILDTIIRGVVKSVIVIFYIGLIAIAVGVGTRIVSG